MVRASESINAGRIDPQLDLYVAKLLLDTGYNCMLFGLNNLCRP